MNHPDESEYGYEPLDVVKSEEDVTHLASSIIEAKVHNKSDSYWENSAADVFSAVIELERLNAKEENREPRFENVIDLIQNMKNESDGDLMTTSLDKYFDAAEERFPGNRASDLWGSFTNLSNTTFSCIKSVLKTAISDVVTENVRKITRKDKRINIEKIGQKRTALFIISSPVNLAMQTFENVVYSSIIKVLVETADRNPEGKLKVPVHLICDDFACGSKISNFDSYISIFRAAGIQCTLLLQSESQLKDMYGQYGATTIINNCDNYVYMGGMDMETCNAISKRINKPPYRIFNLPTGTIIVFRRGLEPKITKRYQIFDDSKFKKIITNKNVIKR